MLNDNTKQFVTFDEQVRLICSYLGDDEASKLYTKVSRFLGLALEDLSLKVLPNIKSAALTINDNLTIDLPDDFLEVSKVGVCCGNREIRLLGRNHDLCKAAFPKPPAIQCCTCDKEETDSTTAQACCPACTFHNFSSVGGVGYRDSFLTGYGGYLYGYQPKQQFIGGTYDIDLHNNRLLLGDGCNVSPGSMLVVEYSAALSGKGFVLIPRKARTTLMYKTAHLIRDKQTDLRSFKREFLELKRSYDKYTLQDWMAAIRRGYKLSPKR